MEPRYEVVLQRINFKKGSTPPISGTCAATLGVHPCFKQAVLASRWLRGGTSSTGISCPCWAGSSGVWASWQSPGSRCPWKTTEIVAAALVILHIEHDGAI